MSFSPSKRGLMSFPGITADTTNTVAELLKKNADDNNAYWALIGHHNHTTEDLLACYDFGATSAILKEIYNRVKETQLPRPEVDSTVLADLADDGNWHKYLGNTKHYVDFLVFFQNEIADIGYKETLNKRWFSGTNAANDLLIRAFGGILHAVIRVGSGLEFGIPTIIAEGLALSATANNWPADFLISSEREAAENAFSGKSFKGLLDDIRNDQKIREACSIKNPMLYFPFLAAAKDEIVSYAGRYRVPVDLIKEKTAESLSVSAFLLGGAMRKDKEVKVDFFLLHLVTSSIYLSTFIAQDWISPEVKVRLLEWTGRFGMLTYGATGIPELHKDEIGNYVPKVSHDGVGNPWLGIIDRAIRTNDDGHTVKAIRALVHGQRICSEYADVAEIEFPATGDMWMKVAAMCVDSAEGCGDCLGGFHAWVRGAGFDEAWESFGPRKTGLTSNL